MAEFNQWSFQALYGKNKVSIGFSVSRLNTYVKYNWSVYDGMDLVSPPTGPPVTIDAFNVYQFVAQYNQRIKKSWYLVGQASFGYVHELDKQFSIYDTFLNPLRISLVRELRLKK